MFMKFNLSPKSPHTETDDCGNWTSSNFLCIIVILKYRLKHPLMQHHYHDLIHENPLVEPSLGLHNSS